MALLPVDEALERILDGLGPLATEDVPLTEAADRVLAAPLKARRTQPPFNASAMDGYAVRAVDVETAPATLSVIGESMAGHRFSGALQPGETVRIFTGAPVPEGADAVLIQENAHILADGRIEAAEPVSAGRHIRRAGLDFREGDPVLEQGRVLDPAALSLAAAAGHATLPVVSRPLVAVIATGDELVPPGTEPGPDQIVASNNFGIAALAGRDGARVADLGIVADREEEIAAALRKALTASADIVITLGGASVGEHDLVRRVLEAEGIALSFWKVAIRPGKPMMFGRREATRVLGLPGNPVSSLVCAHLFLRPMIARLSGRTFTPDLRHAELAAPMRANDGRQDYVRASVSRGPRGLVATPFELQDSSMLSTLAAANALVVREPNAGPSEAGARCQVLMLR
ncbi:gephyrin-like molybdotransferase Glp [Chelativorans salis]|uniref:Molybdopterin molybdenumtransferase n=1 Tax=Chelativorans salis TaxID=2978478 RepID=A0ABT2LL86_9HYPH|nr:gephyrin-like molybdotransferase Glp [Chelativorans sp. EGI FJ00035]MCT7375355.1 molybdopterin molybdotransferase MoeA [Chelativorans sp. EGI FJ00035]